MIVSPDNEGERVDAFVASQTSGLSRSRIQKLLIQGHIKVNGATARASRKLKSGDEVSVTVPEPEPLDMAAEKIALDIVYEDDHIIVVNKEAGMVVHPSAGHQSGSLVNALLGRGVKLSGIGGVARPGIVHRLDKETSGLMVVAKNDVAHQSLSDQLKNRSLTRVYIAVVKGTLKSGEGVIETNIGRHKIHRKKMAVLKEGGKKAMTFYKVVQLLKGGSLVEVKLGTGRTHQIRVHLKSIHCPVVGDKTYGPKNLKGSLINRQALHAWKLVLIHPEDGRELSFTAPPPEDIVTLIRKTGGDPSIYLRPE
ncbi:Ribosomal large subunit pseudouridine synthase D [hydrothermal vent metagenome]|uniref:Ribosomal large subunit pseudouridine synthase D n=1 Tax=hydrothermal vent metagenome TaxID=652676 RepID=A0A3B1CJG5_9ZZZZ